MDATRTGKPRKKSAKVAGSKPAKKSVTRPPSDAVHETVLEDHSQVAHNIAAELQSTAAVLSGHLYNISFKCCSCDKICQYR